VVDVVDGDTVRIDFGDATESVRLIGIDTPEPSGGFQPTECFGDEASAFTRELIPAGSEVLVTFDAELRDRFDRLLGYIYRADDGLFVNLSIIENGLAGQMTIEPNSTFSSLFGAAAAEANRAGLGLWRACDGPDDLADS
jgi:micrococcal nuclease